MKTIKSIKVLGAALAVSMLSGCVVVSQPDNAASATGVAAVTTAPEPTPTPIVPDPTMPADTTPPPDAGDASAPLLSPGVSDVVKLAQAGSSDDVIQAYIQNAQGTFDLSADEIIYVKDLGVSSTVISAMINHDTTLKNQNPNVGPIAAASMPDVAPAPAAPVVMDTTPPPVQVNYFYDQLRPYGSWVVLPGYGWCWQPSTIVLRRDWRPYSDDGHWVWTDAGWFWQSDYSWGWAPFHYGRWYRDNSCGWVWMPDTVWAPAWVTWRSSGDVCGWAPLPPHADFDARVGYRFNGIAVRADFDFGLASDHFTFVAFKDFGDHDFAHRRLPPTQVTRIYKQTTVINNYTINNTTVSNRGIPVERVKAATHAEFNQVAIRDVPAGHVEPAKADGAGKTETAVFRPELKMPAKPPVQATAQKLDTQHPVVAHTEVRAATVAHAPVAMQTLSKPAPIVPGRKTTTGPVPNPAPQSRQQEVSATPPHQGNAPANVTRQSVVTPTRQDYKQQMNNAAPANVTKQPVVASPQPHEQIKPPVQAVHQGQTQVKTPVANPIHKPQLAPVQEAVRTQTPPPAVPSRNESVTRNTVPTSTPPPHNPVPVAPRTEETSRSTNIRPSEPAHAAPAPPAPAEPAHKSNPEPEQNSQVYHPKGYYQTGPGKKETPMYQGINPTMKGKKPE